MNARIAIPYLVACLGVAAFSAMAASEHAELSGSFAGAGVHSADVPRRDEFARGMMPQRKPSLKENPSP